MFTDTKFNILTFSKRSEIILVTCIVKEITGIIILQKVWTSDEKANIGLPYVRIFPDMSSFSDPKFPSGRIL